MSDNIYRIYYSRTIATVDGAAFGFFYPDVTSPFLIYPYAIWQKLFTSDTTAVHNWQPFQKKSKEKKKKNILMGRDGGNTATGLPRQQVAVLPPQRPA